ncbi:DEAD/DEAH box helicase [Mycoplasmopsis adleri]|uniref:DEAD/DEAH box helicase n=1 Tax=Mycoplasmopsis adleri TaxID=51362 RepID=UPI003872B0FB
MNEANKNKQYQSILNNLLDVSPTDTAVFTRVNNKNSFDFYSLFGPKAFDFIYSNKTFDIPILELNLINMCQLLEETKDAEEVLTILAENNVEVSMNRTIMLKKDFANTRDKIISELKASFQKQSLKWKLFLNKANEINTETNIWPMHLGFLFVKTSIEGKSIYAPLFFKEVYLEIRNARPFLVSNGDIKINEKLLFLLNNAGFDLEVNENFGDWTIKELIKYLHSVWGEIYQMDININESFTNIDAESITNQSLEFAPGVVLGLFHPSGGYVRNRMLEIIENNELNKIIQVEFNKNIYKNRVKETIFNPKTSIFKITPTNFSQDKAIASSLNQNTIIWGPPGTGKSQTIVNILTNLLVYGKNSLVCSQKKAALEVIRNRMGELKTFCLFMLNSKNMNKKSFYKPIKEYLSYLENFDEQDNLKPLRIISTKDINFVNNIEPISQDPRFIEACKILAKIHLYWASFTKEFWAKVVSLPRGIIYPEVFNFDDSKQLCNYMLRKNHMRFKIHKKMNWTIKKISKTLFNDFKYFQGNLNEILKEIKTFKIDDYDYLTSLFNILPNADEKQISDENELKKFIAKNIIKRISKFDIEEKSEYTEFAATVRLASLEPYKFIKRYAKMIKKIFPIVIVTPDADLSAWQKEEFDYSILDESSQIFLEKGLPVLYLAKIKILAGDDKQMKPSNWFGVRVSDEESIYGKVDSLLDFARSLGMYSVLLDKNYRSNYASLMTFSSKYFYDSTLDVIDSAQTDVDFKPIEVYEVNGAWENNQNVVEAEYAINLCKQNLYKYNKIIILCFNAKQQDFITANIFKNHPDLEKAINGQTLLLRNIENIQGDEADLVIMSVAYDANTAIHSTYVGRPGGMNALNVTVSRAKDKMIVIKSIKAEDINVLTNNEDAIIFKRWLEFLELSDKQKQSFLALDKEKVELEQSDLSLEVEQTLANAIKDKPFLELAKNESIGTLEVNYVLKKDNKPALCFVVDDYKYANNPEEYVMLKDLCNFIRSKKYTVYKLDRVAWEAKKDEILALINAYESTSEYNLNDDTKEILSSQLEAMDDNSEVVANENSYLEDDISILENNLEQAKVQTKEIEIEQATKTNEEYSPALVDEDTATTIVLDDNSDNDETNLEHQQLEQKEIKMLLSYKLIVKDSYDIPRNTKPVKAFDENTKEWEQVLSREVLIDTAEVNARS